MTAEIVKYKDFLWLIPIREHTIIPDGVQKTINVRIPRMFGGDDHAAFTVESRPQYTTVDVQLPRDCDDESGIEVLNEQRPSVQPILTAPYVVNHLTVGKESKLPEPPQIDFHA